MAEEVNTVVLIDKDGNKLSPMVNFSQTVGVDLSEDDTPLGLAAIASELEEAESIPTSFVSVESNILKKHSIFDVSAETNVLIAKNGQDLTLDDDYFDVNSNNTITLKSSGTKWNNIISGNKFYLLGLNATDAADSTTGDLNVSYIGRGEASLGVTPEIYFDPNCDLYQTSDERLKDIDCDICVSLEDIRKIRKIKYRFKSSATDKLSIGVTAQSIADTFPELVTVGDNGMMSVAYDKLSVIALSAFDALYDRLSVIESRLSALENK